MFNLTASVWVMSIELYIMYVNSEFNCYDVVMFIEPYSIVTPVKRNQNESVSDHAQYINV